MHKRVCYELNLLIMCVMCFIVLCVILQSFYILLCLLQLCENYFLKEIDGRALLLMTRMDVLTGLSLRLGPALKIYVHIQRLQRKHSNSH